MYLGSGTNPYFALIDTTNSDITSFTINQNCKIIAGGAFSSCSSLTSIKIPSSVTSIGDRAFYNCSSLTSITIPSSVTSIGERVFQNCSSLTIYCEVESKPSGWNSRWNNSNCPEYWGLNVNWVYVDGVPRPIE